MRTILPLTSGNITVWSARITSPAPSNTAAATQLRNKVLMISPFDLIAAYRTIVVGAACRLLHRLEPLACNLSENHAPPQTVSSCAAALPMASEGLHSARRVANIKSTPLGDWSRLISFGGHARAAHPIRRRRRPSAEGHDQAVGQQERRVADHRGEPAHRTSGEAEQRAADSRH